MVKNEGRVRRCVFSIQFQGYPANMMEQMGKVLVDCKGEDVHLERIGVLGYQAVRLVIENGVPKDEGKVGVCVERVSVSVLSDA